MVTLTMSPDSSCELDHLTVRDRDGKRMNVIMESDTKYSFTMHGSEAEIEATFSKIEEPPEIDLADIPANTYHTDAVLWAVG